MNWNKLTDILPDIIKTERKEMEDYAVLGRSILEEGVSDVVLFKSKCFPKMIDRFTITDELIDSEYLIGKIYKIDIVEGKSGDDNIDHQVLIKFFNIPDYLNINDGPSQLKDFFSKYPKDDIEWSYID